ncbi:MAG: isochorismatase family protein [Micromonosporaceae bacterium]|nr:isochorismatase family protein [Micromonosporaceae bacterium]
MNGGSVTTSGAGANGVFSYGPSVITMSGTAIDATVGALVTRARAEGVPVIWVQHFDDDLPQGSDGWQYVPELVRKEGEPLIHKHYGDSFETMSKGVVVAPSSLCPARAGSAAPSPPSTARSGPVACLRPQH